MIKKMSYYAQIGKQRFNMGKWLSKNDFKRLKKVLENPNLFLLQLPFFDTIWLEKATVYEKGTQRKTDLEAWLGIWRKKYFIDYPKGFKRYLQVPRD